MENLLNEAQLGLTTDQIYHSSETIKKVVAQYNSTEMRENPNPKPAPPLRMIAHRQEGEVF